MNLVKKVADGALAVLACCAVVVTALAVRRELVEPSLTVERDRLIDDWGQLVEAGHVIGPADAPLKIVEFSDFECSFCRQSHFAIRSAMERFPGRIAIVFRHFPLTSIHQHAFAAASASECAAVQARFTEYHDLLFVKQDSLGVKSWLSYARESGVPDLQSFKECVEAETFRDVVLRDLGTAKMHELSSTPTFVVNGTVHAGVPSTSTLMDWIEISANGGTRQQVKDTRVKLDDPTH
ncbi:MAG: DsbA family protein [Candidatus Binatia bacterium]